MKYECGVEPMFQCEYCNKKFKRRYQVKRHVAIHVK